MISIFHHYVLLCGTECATFLQECKNISLVEICIFLYSTLDGTYFVVQFLMSKLESSTSHLAPFFIFLKILLSLAVFSQVQCSNFLSLLDLLLVGPDLLLKLSS